MKTLELEKIEVPKTFAAAFGSPVECPYHADRLPTARQVMSNEQLIAINNVRNTSFMDKRDKNSKARRTTGDGTVVLTHILRCYRDKLHCGGRPSGAGCNLCAKEHQQQLVPDPHCPRGTLVCAAGCCALRCGMLFEQGKEWKIQFEAAQKKQQQQGQGQPSLINRIVGHSDRAYEQQQQKRSMLHGSSAANAVDVSSDDDSCV